MASSAPMKSTTTKATATAMELPVASDYAAYAAHLLRAERMHLDKAYQRLHAQIRAALVISCAMAPAMKAQVTATVTANMASIEAVMQMHMQLHGAMKTVDAEAQKLRDASKHSVEVLSSEMQRTWQWMQREEAPQEMVSEMEEAEEIKKLKELELKKLKEMKKLKELVEMTKMPAAKKLQKLKEMQEASKKERGGVVTSAKLESAEMTAKATMTSMPLVANAAPGKNAPKPPQANGEATATARATQQQQSRLETIWEGDEMEQEQDNEPEAELIRELVQEHAAVVQGMATDTEMELPSTSEFVWPCEETPTDVVKTLKELTELKKLKELVEMMKMKEMKKLKALKELKEAWTKEHGGVVTLVAKKNPPKPPRANGKATAMCKSVIAERLRECDQSELRRVEMVCKGEEGLVFENKYMVADETIYSSEFLGCGSGAVDAAEAVEGAAASGWNVSKASASTVASEHECESEREPESESNLRVDVEGAELSSTTSPRSSATATTEPATEETETVGTPTSRC